MIEYYWNEDHNSIAVLVSSGYGAGWSTWNVPALAYDKRVVEFWLSHNDLDWIEEVSRPMCLDELLPETDAHREARLFFTECGYETPYFGGYKNIRLVWVPKDVYWRIIEYDGAESVEYFDSALWNRVESEEED